jgi:small subunit ribosomal protein S8
MAMTDPLGDMLTRIRNGQQAKKDSVLTPASKLRANVLEVLKREGYIRGFSEGVSKPGRRVYSGSKELPTIRNGLGITIVSTPRGVLSDAEARTQNVGGEVLAEVF